MMMMMMMDARQLLMRGWMMLSWLLVDGQEKSTVACVASAKLPTGRVIRCFEIVIGGQLMEVLASCRRLRIHLRMRLFLLQYFGLFRLGFHLLRLLSFACCSTCCSTSCCIHRSFLFTRLIDTRMTFLWRSSRGLVRRCVAHICSLYHDSKWVGFSCKVWMCRFWLCVGRDSRSFSSSSSSRLIIYLNSYIIFN